MSWQTLPEYWQVHCRGGFVYDVDDETAGLIIKASEDRRHSIAFVDIYGGKSVIIVRHIVGLRFYEYNSRAAYHNMHDDED